MAIILYIYKENLENNISTLFCASGCLWLIREGNRRKEMEGGQCWLAVTESGTAGFPNAVSGLRLALGVSTVQ